MPYTDLSGWEIHDGDISRPFSHPGSGPTEGRQVCHGRPRGHAYEQSVWAHCWPSQPPLHTHISTQEGDCLLRLNCFSSSQVVLEISRKKDKVILSSGKCNPGVHRKKKRERERLYKDSKNKNKKQNRKHRKLLDKFQDWNVPQSPSLSRS